MKFGILLAAHIIPEWADYYVDYELLKELIYHLCGIKEESEGCCNCLQSKRHPDDVNEELHEEGSKISKQLRARLSRTGTSMNLHVPLLGEESNHDKTKIGLEDMLTEIGSVHWSVEDEVMVNCSWDESKGTAVVDKTTIVSLWITEISQEQRKVSRFYIYMLKLVNEEMEVIKELAKTYFGTTRFPNKGTSSLDNIYYEKNGRPLDSPRNTRRRSVFSVKPLVRNTFRGDQKVERVPPVNMFPPASFQETEPASPQETEETRFNKIGS